MTKLEINSIYTDEDGVTLHLSGDHYVNMSWKYLKGLTFLQEENNNE